MAALHALVLALLVVPAVAAAAPEQVHLGLPSSDAASEASVVWLDTTLDPAPAVTLDAPEGSTTVPAVRVPGPSAGFVYEARLDGLAPATAYAYHVGGRTFPFRTPPAMMGEGFRFVALGDMGITAQSRQTAAKVAELDPSFVLHAGDLSYAEGNPLDWKTWFDLIEPVAATRPWLPALGNHETYTASSTPGTLDLGPAGEMAFYAQRFSLPGNERWYSFDWQGVHFVALDTFSGDTLQTEAPLPAEELAWLDADLAAHADAAWTIAFLHEPAYSSNSHGSSARVQTALVPLLERHGVDLVLQAHDHGYERSFPLRGGQPVSTDPRASVQGQGVVYVTTGGGGQSLYAGWATPTPAWSAAHKDYYHVLEVRVTADALEGRPVATDGTVFEDVFRITKAASPDPGASAPLPRPTPGLEVGAVFAGALAAVALRRRLTP